MARRAGRQGARAQGGRPGQGAQSRRRRGQRRQERGRRPEDGGRHPPRRARRACPSRSSPRSSASPPTARARPRCRTGGRCSRSPRTARPEVDFADARVKTMASTLDNATAGEHSRSICRSAPQRARRVRPPECVAIGRGKLTPDMSTLPDFEAFARAYSAGEAERRGDDAGRRPGDAGLGLSQARARARGLTCSCSSRSKAARSADAIR